MWPVDHRCVLLSHFVILNVRLKNEHFTKQNEKSLIT